jgi:hypothetical protein
MLDFDEHIGNLLAVLVLLRLFVFALDPDGDCPIKDVLAFVTKTSDRAPHLEYFAIWHEERYYWKRIGREWVICDETEFPSLVL